MPIPDELKDVLASDPEYISGALRFQGTRVPVQALIDTLFHGHSVKYFLEGFPDVTLDQAEQVVRWQQEQSRKILGLNKAS